MLANAITESTKTAEMEIKDWITIGSVISLIIGQFVNGHLNRRNEIAKERFKYRMAAIQSSLETWLFLTDDINKMFDPAFIPKLRETRVAIGLYGKDDEIKLIEDFIKNYESNNLVGMNEVLPKLIPFFRQSVRDELKIN